MLGIIFGAMVVMLILTVPIGVMLLVVSLIPSLISPGFSASITCNPAVYLGWYHHGTERHCRKIV